MNPEINVKCRSIIFKYHTLVPKEIIFHVPIFCNDKDKNMILFFYHSLLPFGGTDLKMKTTAIMIMMMMMTKNTKSNYLH